MSLITIGTFAFETQDGPESFEQTLGYGFAEHAVCEGKPRLQAVGDPCRGVTLSVKWNVGAQYPGIYWAALVAMAERKEAVPVVWGSGEVEGLYVITELVKTLLQLDPEGRVLAMDGRITLKEYEDKAPLATMERSQKASRKAPTHKAPAGPGYPTGKKEDVPPSKIVRKP